MSGKTGEKCIQSGVYRCSIHSSQEIPLSAGETFPPCKGGNGAGHAATWNLVRKA
jgi:hypothetical protein